MLSDIVYSQISTYLKHMSNFNLFEASYRNNFCSKIDKANSYIQNEELFL